jgi:hypothetical protein
MFSSYPIVTQQVFDQSAVLAERVEDQHAALAILLNRAANSLGRPFAHVVSPTARRVLESAITSVFAVSDNSDQPTPTFNGIPVLVSDDPYEGVIKASGLVETIGIDQDGQRIVAVRTALFNISF